MPTTDELQQQAMEQTLQTGGGMPDWMGQMLGPVFGGMGGMDLSGLKHPNRGDWSQFYNELLEKPIEFMGMGMGMIPLLTGLQDRQQMLTDPLAQMMQQYQIQRFNQSQNQNPYGDPWNSWGGMFGTGAGGQPVGFGEAQARSMFG